jgi:protein-S-isoprenylcysteine O-methyltransferase Ste14
VISILSIVMIVYGTAIFSIMYIISLQPETLSKRIGQNAYKDCSYLRFISMFFEMIVLAGYILFIFGNILNYSIITCNIYIIRICGVVIVAICIALMIIGMIAAGKESAIPNEQTKLYKGIYDYMRHPQTLGEMISWFGLSLILNNLTLLVYSIIMIPLFIGYTIIEDNDLSIRFGKAHIRYTKKVGIFWKKRI